MLGKILLLLLSVSTFTGFAAPALVVNGDFSQGLKYWQILNRNGVSIEKKAAPGGKNALKVVSTKSHYGINHTFKGKRLKPNTDYTVRGLIKTDGNAQVYLYFTTLPIIKGIPQRSARSRVIRKTTDWTEVHILLNSGNAKNMPVLTRVIGQGTAYFADITVKEGNHLPLENLIVNSDFSKRTRYRDVPDCWTSNIHTGVAEPENYIFRISKEKPPLPGAGVLEVQKVQICNQLIQPVSAGSTYTFSFYAKNAVRGKNTVIGVRFVRNPYRYKKFNLTDNWKRYSVTLLAPRSHIPCSVFSPDNGHFFFSAPQLIMGRKAREWTPPAKSSTVKLVSDIREAVAEAVSRKISGKVPEEKEWASSPAYPIRHLTRGVAQGIIDSHASILHNDQYIFVRFTGKKDPAIKVGTRTTLDWRNICDIFELFITDKAMDGTYVQYAVDVNSHTYSGSGKDVEMLGITSRVTHKKDSWIADVKVPKTLFRSNKNWKIAFCRCYDHKRYGRVSMDWSMSGSRHNTNKFGFLKGVSVKPVTSLELAKLYGSLDEKKLHFEFSNFKKEMKNSNLEIVIFRNTQQLWKKNQILTGAKGEIRLPEDYVRMMDSGTRIRLRVTDKAGKTTYYQASRVLYLMFSSYARHDPAMFVYPKYNFFTEKDRTVDLIVQLDKKQYDRLRVSLFNKANKAVFCQETTHTLAIPGNRIPFGDYKVKVEAIKNGKVCDVRFYESFRKQPFRPEMIRINRLTGCLMDAEKPLLPMLYYPGPGMRYSFDPDLRKNMDRLFRSALKCGFTGVKTTFNMRQVGVNEERMRVAAKYNGHFLADLESLYPPGYYGRLSEKMTSAESEKILIDHTGKFMKLWFGKRGILSYAPYHEPGYYRKGKGIVDSYRVAKILPDLRREDPYRPITGFWAPPHWDANGEPFGSVDGVDYFFVDIYTRNLKRHCDELFRISHASRVVRRPIGQIFNIDNLSTEDRECPTPAEYRAEVYAALIAGYRVFFPYIGVAPVRETWNEMLVINRQLPVIARLICQDECRELAGVNDESCCYAVYAYGKKLIVIASSKENERKSRLSVDIHKLCGVRQAHGKELFSAEKVRIQNGRFEYTLDAAGSGIWVFEL